MWKITIFSQPRGGQKRHFLAKIFLLLISILITGRCIWGGLFEFFVKFRMKKMINFLAQWHIRVFLEFKLFWILGFKSLLRLFGSVFHGSQGSIDKREEIKMIFFWRCDVWKITIFSQPPRWSEKALFCTIFFFSEYRFWSQVGASGVVYLSFLRIYDEKNDKFSTIKTY